MDRERRGIERNRVLTKIYEVSSDRSLHSCYAQCALLNCIYDMHIRDTDIGRFFFSFYNGLTNSIRIHTSETYIQFSWIWYMYVRNMNMCMVWRAMAQPLRVFTYIRTFHFHWTRQMSCVCNSVNMATARALNIETKRKEKKRNAGQNTQKKRKKNTYHNYIERNEMTSPFVCMDYVEVLFFFIFMLPVPLPEPVKLLWRVLFFFHFSLFLFILFILSVYSFGYDSEHRAYILRALRDRIFRRTIGNTIPKLNWHRNCFGNKYDGT